MANEVDGYEGKLFCACHQTLSIQRAGAVDVGKPYKFVGFGEVLAERADEWRTGDLCIERVGTDRPLFRARSRTLGYTIVVPGRKSGFRVGFPPDSNRSEKHRL